MFDPLASVRMTHSESEGGFDPFGYMSPASTDSSAGEPIYMETSESVWIFSCFFYADDKDFFFLGPRRETTNGC